MNRTKNRPLPAGTMTVAQAYTAAVLALLVGLFMLYSINVLSAFFGGLSAFLYAVIYTPLKSRTSLAVFVGAFPGAIPYMLGWVAARNDFDIETGTLFAQQFFWQFPHFWAIAWFSFEDYKRAGYNLLPSGAKDRPSQLYVIIYTIWMIMPAPTKKAPVSPIWAVRPVPSSSVAPSISAAGPGCTHQPRPNTNKPNPDSTVKRRRAKSISKFPVTCGFHHWLNCI